MRDVMTKSDGQDDSRRVESIKNHRDQKNGIRQYLTHFESSPDHEDRWLSYEQLKGFEEVVEKYMKGESEEKKEKASLPKRKPKQQKRQRKHQPSTQRPSDELMAAPSADGTAGSEDVAAEEPKHSPNAKGMWTAREDKE